MAMKPQVNVSLIVTTGGLSVLLLVVIVIGLHAWFLNEEQRELAAKWETSPNTALADLRAEQQAKINSYRWVDRDHRRVAIPVSEAMKLLAERGGKLPATQPTATAATGDVH